MIQSICLERTDVNLGIRVFCCNQLDVASEVNIVDDVNKRYKNIMLIICKNKNENYTKS